MPKYSIGGGYYKSDSLELSAQECINFYPNPPQTKGPLNEISLFSTPGVKLFTNVSPEGSRGFHLFNDVLYSFNGTSVFKIELNGSVTEIGSIDPGGRVSVANNGLVMAIVVPETGNGYFSDGSTVDIITNENFAKPARTVTFIDATFVFNNDTELFVSSTTATNNGQNFDGLDFGTAEIDPDPILSVHNVGNQLYAVGRYTIEVFRNIGGEGFPFQRIPGANTTKGTAARFSFTKFGSGYAYLGSSRIEGNGIWSGNNNQIFKISTTAIDLLINKLSFAEQQNIILYTYSDNGNFFLVVVLESTTIVYDLTASQAAGIPIWHERKSSNNTTKWRFTDSVRAYGYTMVADSETGNIGILDTDTATEFDEVPLRTATGAYLSNEGIALFIDELELVGKAGVGDTIGIDNNNPEVSLSWSDDGGHTFTTPAFRGMGIKDSFKTRAIWRRLGRVDRSRIFRITWQNDKLFAANILWIRGSGGE